MAPIQDSSVKDICSASFAPAHDWRPEVISSNQGLFYQRLLTDLAVMTKSPIAKVLGGPTGHFPVEAEIVGYLANTWSVPSLLVAFAAGWVVILGTTNLLVKRHNPTLGSGDKATILWFVLSTSKPPKLSLSWTKLTQDSLQPGLYICFLKASRTRLGSLRVLLNGVRLLLVQSHQNGRAAGFLWPTMEGIFMVRLEVSDLGSFRTLYGDCHCRTFARFPARYRVLIVPLGLLGSAVFLCRLDDHISTPFATPSSGLGLTGSNLR